MWTLFSVYSAVMLIFHMQTPHECSKLRASWNQFHVQWMRALFSVSLHIEFYCKQIDKNILQNAYAELNGVYGVTGAVSDFVGNCLPWHTHERKQNIDWLERVCIYSEFHMLSPDIRKRKSEAVYRSIPIATRHENKFIHISSSILMTIPMTNTNLLCMLKFDCITKSVICGCFIMLLITHSHVINLSLLLLCLLPTMITTVHVHNHDRLVCAHQVRIWMNLRTIIHGCNWKKRPRRSLDAKANCVSFAWFMDAMESGGRRVGIQFACLSTECNACTY